MVQGAHDGVGRSIAARLDALFEQVHPADRGPYTHEEIAARAAARGYDLSLVYVQQLRRGRRTNPTVRALEGLAAAFDVPLSYFFTDTPAARSREELALAAIVEDEAVREIALRSAQLTPEGVRAVAGVLRNLEGLPGVVRYPPPPAPPESPTSTDAE